MTRKRTIIVGDIHGMLLEFQELVDKVKYSIEKDLLILAGDLVDRGPKSAGVVEFAKNIGAKLVIGNHDYKYIRYRRHERKKTHVGRKHYKNPILLPKSKLEVWSSLNDDLLDYMEAGTFCYPLWEYNTLVVHAGIRPGKEPDKRDHKEYIYTRYIDKDDHRLLSLPPDFTQPPNSAHWSELYDGTVDIVYGHDVESFVNPTIRKNKFGARTIGIDTGACFGGHLTALILSQENPKGSFVQVKAKKKWKEYQLVRPGL